MEKRHRELWGSGGGERVEKAIEGFEMQKPCEERANDLCEGVSRRTLNQTHRILTQNPGR